MSHKVCISILIAAVLLMGCGSKEPEGRISDSSEPTTIESSSTSSTESGGGSGIQIHGAGTGGIAPVTGTESMDGGGGGVQQVAKDKAREAAAKSSAGSMENSSDESGE